MGRWFRKDSVDFAAGTASLAATAAATFLALGNTKTFAQKGKLALLVGSVLTVVATICKQELAGSCTDFTEMRGQLAAEKRAAEMLQSSCHAVHTLVAVLQNEFSTLHEHQRLLQHQKSQIKLLLQNRLEVRRMSAA